MPFFVLFLGCMTVCTAETAAHSTDWTDSTDSYMDKAMKLVKNILSKVLTLALYLYPVMEWIYSFLGYCLMKGNCSAKDAFAYIIFKNPPAVIVRLFISIWTIIQKFVNMPKYIA